MRAIAARVAVAALQQAIARRQPPPGVVHHSDQGIQYASAEYREVFGSNHMVASMSRPANPYDNAVCESFVKTLKQEEIYCHPYRDFEELSAHLEEFLENYYNRQRLHSALGYRTPEEFEQAGTGAATSGGTSEAATLKYFYSAASAGAGSGIAPGAAHGTPGRNSSRRPGKDPEGSGMRFLGMAESIGPMGSLTPLKAGAGMPPPVGRPRSPARRRDGRRAPGSSSAMSSGGYASIGLLASSARLRFTGSPIIKHWTNRKEGFSIER